MIIAEPAAKESAGIKIREPSSDLCKLPPIGDVVRVSVCGNDRFPICLALGFPGVPGHELAIATQHIRREDFGVVADLFAGDKIVFVYKFAVVLAFGAYRYPVGGGAVFVAFVDGADGLFHGFVPLADELFSRLRSEVLSFEPRPERGFRGFDRYQTLLCRTIDDRILARHVNNGLGFFFLVGIVHDNVGAYGGQDERQYYNRDDDDD